MLKLARLNNGPEIFYTIQGEGKNLGVPSVFIRLSLCNLYCFWCDTDFTWNWKNTKFTHIKDATPGYTKFSKEEYILEMSADEVIGVLKTFPCKNLVITGGEPLVQQKELKVLLAKLKGDNNNGYHLEMETNGTLIPDAEFDRLIDQYNVSPKLLNSKVELKDRLKPEALAFFAQSSKSNFKFVINAETDLKEVLDLATEYKIGSQKIYLMPQGMTQQSLREKQQWLVEICKLHGFNYTDRLHIHIFGDKRGV